MPNSLVKQDQREVSQLSQEGMSFVGELTLYPAHYRSAFACSLLPIPLSHRLLLRVAVPLLWFRSQEDIGLTTFHRCNRVGQVVSARPVVRRLRQRNAESLHLTTYHFGSSLTAA